MSNGQNTTETCRSDKFNGAAAEVFVELIKARMERFDHTRDLQVKVYIPAWTFFSAVAWLAFKEDFIQVELDVLPFVSLALIVIGVFFSWWLARVQISLDDDKKIWLSYQMQLQRLLVPVGLAIQPALIWSGPTAQPSREMSETSPAAMGRVRFALVLCFFLAVAFHQPSFGLALVLFVVLPVVLFDWLPRIPERLNPEIGLWAAMYVSVT